MSITFEEAEQRTEGYFRAALTALPKEARPEPALIESYDCDDPANEDTKGKKIASVDYEIHSLARRDYPRYVTKLESWWLNNNFYVLIDERPRYESIKVETIDEDFQMRATSPCVWPDGTHEQLGEWAGPACWWARRRLLDRRVFAAGRHDHARGG